MTLRMPIFCTFSRRMSSRPLGMMVSFTLASSRPSLPALSLAFFIWPSFSLLSDSAFSASFFFSFWNSTACGASIFAMRSALSASGGRGASFSHMKTRMVAKIPSTMLVPSMYWTISGSSMRGLRDAFRRVDPADLDAQVAAVGERQLGAIAAREVDFARGHVGDRGGRAGEDQVALQLGGEAQHVTVAAGREQQEALLAAELRRDERGPLAGADPHLAALAQHLVTEDLAAPDDRHLQRRLVAERLLLGGLVVMERVRRGGRGRRLPGRAGGRGQRALEWARGQRAYLFPQRFLSSALCCSSFMNERLSGADMSSSSLTRFKK